MEIKKPGFLFASAHTSCQIALNNLSLLFLKGTYLLLKHFQKEVHLNWQENGTNEVVMQQI
jgi:hypothetical protein